jgi:V/A-type H+-transporting ATPase subunit I
VVMAVARMKKITIYASKELRGPIFERLRDLGVFHITAESSGPRFLGADGEADDLSTLEPFAAPDDISTSLSRLQYLRDYFGKYAPIKRSFIDGFTGKKPEVSLGELRQLSAGFDIEAVYEKAKAHEKRQKEISDEVSRLNDEVKALSPWEALDIPLDRLGPTELCHSALAVFPNSALSKIQEGSAYGPVFHEVLWEERSETGIWLVVYGASQVDVSSFVATLGGRVVTFKESNVEGATVRDRLGALEERIRELTREKENIIAEDRDLSSSMLDIMALIDYYLDKENLERLGRTVPRTAFTLVIEGYVKAKDLHELEKGLKEFTEMELVAEDPSPGDDVPVFLENHPIIQPFEVITNIFGFPRYDEIDPTPFLAPFFWLFFGICLGDAMYGIVLTIGSWWFIRSQGLKPPGDKLPRLLMYSGLSTLLAGAATNSWMADLFSVFLPGTAIERFFSRLALINPIEDPLTMMLVSFGFGIIHVWVGIGVKMLSSFRQGEYMDGIWSSGSWLVFLPGLVLWVLSKAGFIAGPVPFYIMVVGALMVMYGASRGQKNILLKPFSGLYGLYGIVSYFSDTLSYSRLLALGLASAIIGVVVNKISQLVSSMIPYIGWVLVPVILAGGHLFNLVINVLGSFIHSGRLQFVEFFTKFFEGGGTPFRPLKRVSENVSVQAVD